MLQVWTDGSCKPNPGRGAWGFLDRHDTVKTGIVQETTNNRMELQAVVEAIHHYEQSIKIYSDSQYVVLGINKWIHKWKKQEFKNVKNADLWKELDCIFYFHGCQIEWVRGHSVDAMNNKIDSIINRLLT